METKYKKRDIIDLMYCYCVQLPQKICAIINVESSEKKIWKLTYHDVVLCCSSVLSELIHAANYAAALQLLNFFHDKWHHVGLLLVSYDVSRWSTSFFFLRFCPQLMVQDQLLLDHLLSGKIFLVKYSPRSYLKCTLLQKYVANMLLEQCACK